MAPDPVVATNFTPVRQLNFGDNYIRGVNRRHEAERFAVRLPTEAE